jgi:aminopeptidase 2
MSTFFPKWEIWQRTGTTEMQDALDFDSRRSSHPIQLSHAATDPNELFDDISYQKGGCVLRMISEFIGEKEFVE